MEKSRLHPHRMTSVTAEHFVSDGGRGLAGPDPVEDLALGLFIVEVPHDAVGANAGLTQRTVRGQKSHISGIGAVVVGQAQDGHIRAERVEEGPAEEGEVPDIVAHNHLLAVRAGKFLADLLRAADRCDDLGSADDLGPRSIRVDYVLPDQIGPLLHHGPVFRVVLGVHVFPLVVEHRDSDGGGSHGALL